jgi:hypothetical protein
MAFNIDDLRVLDSRKSVLVVQLWLGFTLVDLGTAGKSFSNVVDTLKRGATYTASIHFSNERYP